MIAALRYEWVRVATIRSTRFALVLCFLAIGLIAWAASAPTYHEFDQNGPVGDPTVEWWGAFTQPTLLTAIFAAIVASQNIGQEYRFGLIRLTLTAFPQRWSVLGAKLVSVVATGLVFAVVSYAASWIGVALRGYPTPPAVAAPGEPAILLRGAVFLVLWSLSAWALAGITRQTAIGIAVPVVSGFILEQILGGVLSERVPWLQDVLPWSNASRWFAEPLVAPEGIEQHFPPTGWQGLGIFSVWVVVLVVLEVVAFLRRDA
ncbi:MAG TPA: ABC transporter permease subunit [Candidatus Nanopelagicales bacterium]|nr:ABC transporter permease subunit [Candidatus Nanopelagicales bacterium]